MSRKSRKATRWDLGDDDVWDAFLADHPELSRNDPVPKP